jgi:hypothetical protein
MTLAKHMIDTGEKDRGRKENPEFKNGKRSKKERLGKLLAVVCVSCGRCRHELSRLLHAYEAVNFPTTGMVGMVYPNNK